jgi:hypothetical protein
VLFIARDFFPEDLKIKQCVATEDPVFQRPFFALCVVARDLFPEDLKI